MELFRRDVRFAVRALLKRPGTSALAAIALALGIGLTTTMFSIVDGVFLRGLPFERADRLLVIGEQDARLSDQRPRDVPMNDYLEWREAQRSFEELAAFSSFGATLAADDVTPRQWQAARIDSAAFAILRVRPAFGRILTEADAAEGAAPVVLISDTVWRTQLGGDRDVVGRTVRVNRSPATVIGVMPHGFGFPHDEDVWLPLARRRMPTRADNQSVIVFGRLRDNVSVKAANAEFRALTARIFERESIANMTASAVPFLDRFMSRQVTGALTMMLGAVFAVLLIACVDVTNLLLARAAERVREVGICLAIGASRARVIRQFLIEGALLSCVGAAAGIGIAFGGIAFFRATMADSTPPFWIDVRVDGRVLLFTAVLTCLAALASSLAPALRSSMIGISGVLKESGRSTAALRIVRFSRWLIVAQMTLSFALLLVSGLLIKSIIAVNRIGVPFRTNLLHARVELPTKLFPDRDSVREAQTRLLELVAAESGVGGAAATTALPDLAGSEPVAIEGRPVAADERSRARRIAVSDHFFEVTAIAPRSGRLFDSRDRGGPPVAVVSGDFVQRFFPGQDPIGRRVRIGADSSSWRTIVGVIPPLVFANTTSASSPTDVVIVPLSQEPARWFALLVSAAGDPALTLPAVRRAVARIDRDLPLTKVATVASLYYDQSWPIRLFGTLFATFGGAALLLAAAGLYGVTAFSVRSRTQELGVRMALGADRATIVWMLLRRGLVAIGAGMALGLGIGGLLGRQLELFLFQVKPWDGGVFATITIVLAATALAATLVPAWRAGSIDPAIALRDN